MAKVVVTVMNMSLCLHYYVLAAQAFNAFGNTKVRICRVPCHPNPSLLIWTMLRFPLSFLDTKTTSTVKKIYNAVKPSMSGSDCAHFP